jgi:hypothetical protein
MNTDYLKNRRIKKMDTSKRYIKMCKKADEIRAHWKPKDGDYFYGEPQDLGDERPIGVYQFIYNREDEYFSILPQNYDPKTKEFDGLGDEDDAVFLPNASQLMEMVDSESPFTLIAELAVWAEKLPTTMKDRLQTNEQILLAFVMKKNNGMSWTGSDWQIKR